MPDCSERVTRLQSLVTSKEVKLTASVVATSQLTTALDNRACSHASLQSELDALRAAGKRREGVLRVFARGVYTGYSGLIRTHATSYHT